MAGLWSLESRLWQQGYSPVAGIDEVGRGALAGPVVVAAVILPYRQDYPFHDSKGFDAREREKLAAEVKARALAWAVAFAGAAEVDAHNVLKATHLAAGRALEALSTEAKCILERGATRLKPGALITDYLKLEFDGFVLSPAKADSLSYSVAAASILAKVTRDRLMIALAETYPAYALASNKGYGSPAHLRGLAACGPCPEHRRSFKPVARFLSSAGG